MSDAIVNTRTSIQVLRQTYTDQILQTSSTHTDIRDAHFNKQDIFAFNSKASAAYAYTKLIRELFNL